MEKREISSTLRNLKFMQRGTQREEKKKIVEEEVKPDESFFSPGIVNNRKCVVIMESDPHPGAVIGRMSFRSFNPSIEKLNEAAADDGCQPNGSNHDVKMPLRENGASSDQAAASKPGTNTETNGDLKRKQTAVVPEPQYPSKSPKNLQSGQQSSPSNGKSATFKQPKRDKVDWSVLRPPKSQNKK